MKTVEETKRNIVTCMELNMEHFMPGATQKALEDALACIEQLEADNAQLNRCIENMTDKLNAMIDESVKWKAERDAAVNDLRYAVSHPHTAGVCYACKHHDDCQFQDDCDIMDNNHWEWRGVQKEG